MKNNHSRLLLALILSCVSIWGISCQKKEMAAPPPVPTPLPPAPAGTLVFVQRGHLALLDLSDDQVTPLTSGTSTEWFPSCSPKGDKVVYWSNAEGGLYQLWEMDLLGSHQRQQLTFDETDSLKTADQNLLVNDSPSWSSDGGKIVYASGGDIWMMDADGYNPETLLLGHSALCPVLSPDGKNLIFISNLNDPVYNVWELSLSDKSLTQLTQYTDWNVGSPSFSSDGQKIIFNLYRANMTQIYTMDADGTNPVNITNSTHSLCPKYAQGDRRIVYCFAATEDDTLNIYEAAVNGTDIKALTTDGGTSPSWTPALQSSVLLPTPVGK